MRFTSIVLPLAALLMASPAVAAGTQVFTSTAHFHVLRVAPGQDLRQEIQRYAAREKLRAGFVATCAGDVSCAAIRAANQQGAIIHQGHYEIVSLTGTLAADAMHLQASFADSAGATFGGQLTEGTTVFTPVELVIGELTALAFTRDNDPVTGAKRLIVRKR